MGRGDKERDGCDLCYATPASVAADSRMLDDDIPGERWL